MGRSLKYSNNNVSVLDTTKTPVPTEVVNTLTNLKVGDIIQFSLNTHSPHLNNADDDLESYVLTRTPSSYGKHEIDASADMTYRVLDIDAEFGLYEAKGIRAIRLWTTSYTDANNKVITDDTHICTWILTTDGAFREIEGLGINGVVAKVVFCSQEH